MLRVVLGLVFMFMVVSAASARAQEVPARCSRDEDRTAYRTGWSGGRSLTRAAWSSRNVGQSCSNVDRFQSAVTAALTARIRHALSEDNAQTQTTACRSIGFTQGATDTVDLLLNDCADICFLDGRFIGEIAAVAYCELSIFLDGLELGEFFIRGPTDVCGTAFEVGCDSNFQSRAVSYRNADNEQCAPYTRAPLLEVFFQAQNNQCAYEPLDPEP